MYWGISSQVCQSWPTAGRQGQDSRTPGSGMMEDAVTLSMLLPGFQRSPGLASLKYKGTTTPRCPGHHNKPRMLGDCRIPNSKVQLPLWEEGHLDKALDVLELQAGLPSIELYRSLLNACSRRKALAYAKRVHAHLASCGLETTTSLGEYVVMAFVKCGGLVDAVQLFQRLPDPTVSSWTAVISGYIMAGDFQEAWRMYHSMRENGTEPNNYIFVSLLKACCSLCDLEKGRHMHAEILKCGLESDMFVGTSLVTMYAKCGSMADAQYVFHGLVRRDVAAWNAMLAACTQQGRPDKAWQLYAEMLEEEVSPDARTFVSALQACGMLAENEPDVTRHGQSIKVKSLLNGKRIHAEAWRKAYLSDVFVCNTLVGMYARCGSIGDAEDVFCQLSYKTVVSWNVMLTAYTQQFRPEYALLLYEQMVEEGMNQNNRTFLGLLQTCIILAESENDTRLDERLLRVKALQQGNAIHAEAWKRGYESDVFLGSSLISLYGRCGSIIDAHGVFDGLSVQDVVSWNALLSAYLQNDQAQKTLLLYEKMLEEGPSPETGSFVIVIQACGMCVEEDDRVLEWQSRKATCLNKGKVIHANAWSKGSAPDAEFRNTLIYTYDKCGSLLDAEEVFQGLPEPDIVSWNVMLSAYVHQGLVDKTLQLYVRMHEEGISADHRTLLSMLQACCKLAEEDEEVLVNSSSAKVNSLQMGKVINARACGEGYMTDVFLANALISMYGKCGSSEDALVVFDGLAERNVVTWTAILEAYSHQGQANKSLQLYRQFLEEGGSPNSRTFVGVLRACGLLGELQNSLVDGSEKEAYLQIGKAVQAYAWQNGCSSDANIGNVLITMFGRCGSIMDARYVFDTLSQRTVISWNAMLAAYIQQGQPEKTLRLYEQMREEGVRANEITMLCILQECSVSGRLAVCRQIHHHIMSTGKVLNPLLANTLIHAYGRCASMSDAQCVFNALAQPNVVSWSALIAGYAREGNFMASLRVYDEMQQSRTKPNGVTFLSLLSACSHAGLVDKGMEYFQSMIQDHNLWPESAHYVTIIDLLARAGYFTRIDEIVWTMPFQPDFSMWLCLLSACRQHGKLVLGEYAFECAVNLRPTDAAAYVLISSMYAHAGQWDRAKEVNLLRQKAGAWEKPGQTWISHQQVHTFVAGGCNHSEQTRIFAMLGELTAMMTGQWQLVGL